MIRSAAVLRLALLIALPVVGLEQIRHTSPTALAAFPVYEALHWLSDSLLALPLALLAVWAGGWIARRAGHDREALPDVVLHAAFIALVFALLLVPGAVLHEEADRLTHAHASLAIHTHGVAESKTAVDAPTYVLGFVGHAVSDGIEGQVVGLPVAILALLRSLHAQRRNVVAGQSECEHAAPVVPASGVITRLGGERRG
jgi:hypothetical protein